MANHGSNKLLGAALLGSALAGAAAFLLSDKGKRIRKGLKNNLEDIYCDVSEQVQDFTDQVSKRSGKLSKEVCLFGEQLCEGENINWVIGAIAAGILGLSASYMLSSNEDEGPVNDVKNDLCNKIHSFTDKSYKITDDIEQTAHDAARTFEDRVSCSIKAAQKVLESIDKYTKAASKKNLSVDSVDESTINQLADWAVFGLRLYNSLKK